MKKILVLLGLFLFIQNCCLSTETLQGAVDSNITMSDLSVFNEKNLFGLKDKNGRIIVKPEYKKLIRLGESSWIVQKKNKYGLIDNSGNFLLEPKYRHVDRMLGKYLKIGNEHDFAVYNEKGEIIIPPEYTSINLLFGEMFLTYKNYKYGVVDKHGKVILDNIFDDIYMPQPNVMRIQYNGEWYEIEQIAKGEINLPEDVQNIKNNSDFKITAIMKDPAAASGYSVVTFTDYFLKIFSSISPSHEETIDELMLSQGAETVSIFMKLTWLPKYPYTYVKKYYHNIRTPNNGPLSDVKNELKQKLQ
ncbi:MAG: WG repeat-containing protein [Candidatus Gastranaerophilaceae bacterium]